MDETTAILIVCGIGGLFILVVLVRAIASGNGTNVRASRYDEDTSSSS